MAKDQLQVLNALDVAKTQWYHFTAIVIAGMGFFTDAYDLFCISLVTKLIGRIYYYDGSNKPGSLPSNVSAAINGVAFCGTFAGQLFFGWLGDRMGRKRVYGMTLMLMVIGSIASGLSFGKEPKAVVATLCFFRFWLGFGIGGDYPLSATIMSEYANKKTRGAFIAAVFAMQGFGILAGGMVAIVVSSAFKAKYPAPPRISSFSLPLLTHATNFSLFEPKPYPSHTLPNSNLRKKPTQINFRGGTIGMTTTTTTSLSGGAGGGKDRVLAAAQQIVKSLNTPKEVREDMLLIFSTFDNRLSGISDLINGEDDDLHRFEAAEKVILRWDASLSTGPSRNFTSLLDYPNDTVEYFSAVDEIIQFMEQFSIAPPPSDGQIMADRAENAIQLAMTRLEDELRHALIRSTVPLNAESLHGSIKRISLSFASHIDENLESFGEFSDRGYDRFHSLGASLDDEDVAADLVHPDAVVEVKEIIDRMVRSGYERECLQVYSSVRRDALDECLVILGVEKLSIEEVQKIEWKILDEKMKNWVRALKVSVRVLLSGEKRLCDSVFGELDEMKEICFNKTAKGCVMQLLNFAEAVAICKRSPEKLFRILDMYEALRDALPDLQALVLEEFVIGEVRGVLSGLGEAAKGTFAEFESCIRNETSKKQVITGDVHPLPRYVMNYLKLLVDYGDHMDLLLEISEEDLHRFQNDFGGDGSQFESMSPLGRRVLLLMSQLEYNLEEKSRLYEDNAMKHIFLMNNLYYLVRKVKDSDLGKVLGDDWIRKRRGQIRQYATGYLRASWSKALSCLKDEGIGGSSSNASKTALKERFKSFNACFEEIYRIQTAWKVPDEQLREELRISISEKVIPAYRSFYGRFSSQLEGRHVGKYIKYTPDDLEIYLSDLFEGSPAVLHHIRRKST